MYLNLTDWFLGGLMCVLNDVCLQVVCVELGSGSGRRLLRRVTLNPLEDVAVCWWPQDDPSQGLWPSALGPVHTDTHNLVMLGCSAADTLKVGSLTPM